MHEQNTSFSRLDEEPSVIIQMKARYSLCQNAKVNREVIELSLFVVQGKFSLRLLMDRTLRQVYLMHLLME